MAQPITFYTSTPDSPVLGTLPGSDWKPVPGWMDDPTTGKRKPSGQQERDENGVPLWDLTLVAQRVTFGRPEPELITLRTASMTKPTPEEVLA